MNENKVIENEELERGLSNRHLQLIAIGGAIGTGLFLGSGKSIHLAGPSILLTYTITGIMLFFIMRALGELLVSDLKYNSFVDFTKEFLGTRWAFLVGWSYWLCWICVAMADLTAVGIYIQYWIPDIPTWLPGLIGLALLVIINLLTVKLFGEFEFWFALIKIIAIITLIIIGVYLIFTKISYQSSTGETIVANFSHLYDRGGFFAQGFSGFLLSFQMVIFAFAGIELIGLTAGETANPLKSLPKAINSIPFRIFLFYIGSLVVIMSIYPWDVVNPEESPFVNVFAAAGITAAATIVNFVVLTSAASACNSAIFSTSRMLYSLAKNDDAPKKFTHLSKHKVPSTALFFSCVLIALTILLNYFIPNAVIVFDIISGVSTVCFIFIWFTILMAHLKYRKIKQEAVQSNVFKMPFAPYSNYFVIGFLAFGIIILAFDNTTKLALIFTPIWFLVLNITYNLTVKKFKSSRI